MPYKITRQHIEVPPPASLESLRRAFERAVGDLYEGDRSVAKHPQYGAPIVPRRVLGITKVDAEKRALSDAARALAQLWKV